MSSLENNDFWASFYRGKEVGFPPSSFSKFVGAQFLSTTDAVLELGCGDGRDAIHLSRFADRYVGIDLCTDAINFAQRSCEGSPLAAVRSAPIFVTGDVVSNLERLLSEHNINFVYSRFFIHSISAIEQQRVLEILASSLRLGSCFAFEFRTLNDPLFDRGEIIDENIKFTDHMRRFINFTDFVQDLVSSGVWNVEYSEESRGWSKLGDDDPVLGRVVARKV
ncbi:class I SAM-dependent methyltransferase [Yoonia vestfoldensis]|uniref:Methyltransferase domain protein n=1 Tax=Yoonia vestfoldensis TaxID=245188 RepID=A0A1Y0EEA7_9RHOB|nr:class I SAM-dependent methyltransferase [Yoonia vestfoldensis]ARU01701.1 methyltransferase domain protein [Yoonia vestfoldensis]